MNTVPDEYIKALGRMTLHWGYLEASTMMAFSKFAGYPGDIDWRAVAIMANANFAQRVDTISALCEQLLKEFPSLEGYDAVITKLRAASRGRNKYAHNSLGTVSDSDTSVYLTYATARGALKTNVELTRVQDIDEVTRKIIDAQRALLGLVTGKKYPAPAQDQNA